MRHPAVLLGALALLGGAVVFAQPRPTPRPAGRPAGRPAAARPDGGAAASPTAAAGAVPGASLDGGAEADGAVTAAQVGDASVTVADVEYPMHQRGTGTVIHYPVPEQLARTAVPVFAQIRSSAPMDHVSVFYRGPGARRYTELRMNPLGQQFRLPSGYGAMIPCDDIFPPRLEYYVAAYDSSGAPNGTAGTAEAPLALPIVERRRYPAPTLPGQPLPRTCGALTTGATARDAGVPSAPVRGSADLGEPCQTSTDCRRGLRCGSTRTCVFEQAN